MWQTYLGRVEGLLLGGDKNVPPTKWWNHIWLILHVWKTVSVLAVPIEVKAFRVGYIPESGVAKYNTKVLTVPWFAVRHGHEDCRFFAIDLKGTELPLEVSRRTTVDRLDGIKLV